MDEVTKALTSPAWWISVVVVGIVINLVSAYLKPPLDQRLSRVSSWRRVRSQQIAAERQALMEELRSSHQEQIMFAFEEMRERSKAVYYLVVSVYALVFHFGTADMTSDSTRIFSLAAFAIMALASSFSILSSIRMRSYLYEARFPMDDSSALVDD